MPRPDFILALVFLAAICGCTSIERNAPAMQDPHFNGSSMTPGDANRLRMEIHGQTVVLRGFLRYRDDDFGIWTSEEELEKNDISQCVTPLATGKLGTRLQASDGKLVRLTGRFDKFFGDEDMVMAGPCNFSGLWVTAIDFER